ncbi:MAG: asparagine synthase (glutamine-hydrolyzing) [Lachnospiraceae bacterium]|nr:asparagine synthase (glutamine-hydrolyzing) [Lachnospiraceae bacterium]
MCGIAGIINKQNGRVDEAEIRKMNDIMAHRGPDSEGIYIDHNIGLGHRRLSIVDLTDSGSQPMISYDRRFVLIFNGEIYNYIELKEELQKEGAKFCTETDTEVIIEAYRYWGKECSQCFNGMWSIVLYDTMRKQVFISRDRFGVKPLYIYESEEEIIFASEIKCITAIRPQEKLADITQIARYLRGVQEDLDEHTFYRNIHNFPKSHNMIYDLHTKTKEYQKYWEINVAEFQNRWKYGNPYKKFRELLEDSIRIRLRADVEVGASLSGGLDSSTIVGISCKKFHTKMHTFSSIYNEKNCDEREFIDCMNEYADAIPHYIYPEQSEDIMQDIKDLIYYHDGPCHSASPYSGYCVYRGVDKQVKVLLDGQGADELFGGYLTFYNAKLKELLRKNTFSSKIQAVKLVLSVQNEWPDKMYLLNKDLLLKTLGARGYRELKKERERKGFRKVSDVKIKYKDGFDTIDLENNLQKNGSIVSELDKDLYLRFWYKILPRILHDVDRNSMARSLEVRLPFLDYRLVEFSYTLPDQYKIRGRWTKYIMRKSCKKYLPREIFRRRSKMGFPAPFDKWVGDERFREKIKEYIDAFRERNIVDSDSIEQIYTEHLNGDKNWADELFRMMSLEMWLQSEIDKAGEKWKFETA